MDLSAKAMGRESWTGEVKGYQNNALDNKNWTKLTPLTPTPLLSHQTQITTLGDIRERCWLSKKCFPG